MRKCLNSEGLAWIKVETTDLLGEHKAMKQYEYDTVIVEDPDSGGAYVAFPWETSARSSEKAV